MYDEELRREKQTVMTGDGSRTLYSVEFGETYHSDKDGALHESLQKHVLSAFRLKHREKRLTILDICFGLGYNTLATLYYVKKEQLSTQIHIISPEFDRGLVESLSSFVYPEEFATLKPIIDALSRECYYEDKQFKIEILIGDARKIIPQIKERFDIVYQDPFSPAHNPLLWTKEYFAHIREVMKEDAVLTTYSIAADVRMGLHENGFHLFMLSGEKIRSWMLASPQMWESLDFINMELKKKRNPDAKSLRDIMFKGYK
ncbi:MAG: hypothetical protein DRG30_00245 [Epsilonproteobacteria bacterium]|nr:MAG: hypothetical protein DRG30_00245 [Campylobacterota bacterium]